MSFIRSDAFGDRAAYRGDFIVLFAATDEFHLFDFLALRTLDRIHRFLAHTLALWNHSKFTHRSDILLLYFCPNNCLLLDPSSLGSLNWLLLLILLLGLGSILASFELLQRTAFSQPGKIRVDADRQPVLTFEHSQKAFDILNKIESEHEVGIKKRDYVLVFAAESVLQLICMPEEDYLSSKDYYLRMQQE